MEMQIREYQKQDFQPLKEVQQSRNGFQAGGGFSAQLPDKLHLFTGGRT